MQEPGPSTSQAADVYYNNYNLFFHSNVCHICKQSTGITAPITACSWCRMISYCDPMHLKLHREDHKEICQAILSQSEKIFYSRNMTDEQWAKLKEDNMKCIKKQLRRELERYEEQMFLFAKSCVICHRQDSLAVSCDECISVNKCPDHNSTPYEHSCRELQMCLTLNIIESTTKEEDEQNVLIELLSRRLNNEGAFYLDMRAFIENDLKYNRNFNRPWPINNYTCSEYFSRPLTLFSTSWQVFAVGMIMMDTFLIHIIAGSFTDLNSLWAWEILLHESPSGTVLQIVMIGSRLQENHLDIEICETCRRANKRLQYDYLPTMYDVYVRSTTYSKPHMIVGYDVDFEDYETLTSTLTALQLEDCPLILTCKSNSNMHKVMSKIWDVLKKHPPICRINNFSSCRPYRDYENNSVFYLSQYVLVYRNKPILRFFDNTFNISTNSAEVLRSASEE